MKLNLFILVICFATQLQGQYLFQINDFMAAHDDLDLVKNARIVGDRLRLTASMQQQEGACWFSKSKIHLPDGFETEFTFLISGNDETFNGGDGFAFVMQNQGPQLVGGRGDNIGYKEIPHALAIEFDTKDDNEGSKNHVNLSFYNPATGQYRRYATVHEIPEISDGKAHFTKIIYQEGVLHVYLDSYIFPVLSVKIDISEKLRSADGNAWLGFTSATSGAYANHDLLQWNLKQYLPPPEDLAVETREVFNEKAIQVKGRKLRIRVWDHNRIDGDVISLRWGKEWVLKDHELEQEPHEFEVTLHGFEDQLVLFANNIGMIPPNTATISIFDGISSQRLVLESDLEKSEAVIIQYRQ